MKGKRGFILLTVVLTLSMLAMLAFWLNRETGMRAAQQSAQSNVDRARYVAEAGLQAVAYAVLSRDCPNSSTTKEEVLFGGTYDASSTAVYDDNVGQTNNPWKIDVESTGSFPASGSGQSNVTLRRTGVIAFRESRRTYTRQPGAVVGLDTYVNKGGAQTVNYGNTDSMPWNSDNELLIQFDLSAFPQGTVVYDATLALYFGTSSFFAYTRASVYRMNEPWVEGTGSASPVDGATWLTRDGNATWTVSGGSYEATALDSAEAFTAIFPVVFEVTEVARAWINGSATNHGFRVLRNTSTNTTSVLLSDYSDEERRPQLTIRYWLPCGTSQP